MTGRALVATIYDLLTNDPCLAPYLDPADELVTHGGEDPCGQPFEVHALERIRRAEQGSPGDFCRAVVTFGGFSRTPFFGFNDRSRETWSFIVGIFVRSTVTGDDGTISVGDTWALDMYDHVVRILGWGPLPANRPECPAEFLVARMAHVGDTSPLSFQEDLRAWRILTRFSWITIGEGLRIPAADCCGEPDPGAGLPVGFLDSHPGVFSL
jgi:hypothetical protein